MSLPEVGGNPKSNTLAWSARVATQKTLGDRKVVRLAARRGHKCVLGAADLFSVQRDRLSPLRFHAPAQIPLLVISTTRKDRLWALTIAREYKEVGQPQSGTRLQAEELSLHEERASGKAYRHGRM